MELVLKPCGLSQKDWPKAQSSGLHSLRDGECVAASAGPIPATSTSTRTSPIKPLRGGHELLRAERQTKTASPLKRSGVSVVDKYTRRSAS